MKLVHVGTSDKLNKGKRDYQKYPNRYGVILTIKSCFMWSLMVVLLIDVILHFLIQGMHLFFMWKKGSVIYLLILIEQEHERIVSHRSQYTKWEGKFVEIHVMGKFWSLIIRELHSPKQNWDHKGIVILLHSFHQQT